MSSISYFQPYSQKENWATNSTLLLLSRLYHTSRQKFESVINNLAEGIELQVGVTFSQQHKGRESVMDGIIEQEPFKILIETKLHHKFWLEQLAEHSESFRNYHGKKILLGLSKSVDDRTTASISEHLRLSASDVVFINTTFSDLISSIRDYLHETDFELHEILDDYETLCEKHDLVDLRTATMGCFAVGKSWKENLTYKIYYTKSDRSHRPFAYVGLYYDRNIRHIGKVSKLIHCDLIDDELVGRNGSRIEDLNIDDKQRIKSIIKNTKYYSISNGHQFFLLESIHPVTLNKKPSTISVVGKKYIYLREYEGFKDSMDAESLASILNEKYW